MIPKALERELETLVKTYENWITDDADDEDLISAVGEFCRMVRDVIPSTRKKLER